mmetsp:Transcript_856/g.1413  ORF Transcript_856/g.1413 Transcript_856/m.1413 type:complete len:87 (+) Transcript_856:611-871(+)
MHPMVCSVSAKIHNTTAANQIPSRGSLCLKHRGGKDLSFSKIPLQRPCLGETRLITCASGSCSSYQDQPDDLAKGITVGKELSGNE